MPCQRVGDAILCTGGPERQIRDASGREWRFEMHSYAGPVVLGRRGDPLAAQPAGRSPFWPAVTQWDKQGRRVVDGWCVWEPEPERRLIHLGGRHYAEESALDSPGVLGDMARAAVKRALDGLEEA